MKTAATITKEVTPAGKFCTKDSHYVLTRDTDADRCPTCGRKLWRSPPQKCSRHGVWHCPDCFSDKELEALRGFTFYEQDEEENEDEGQKD